MRTTTKTEFAVMGLKPDGEWWKISKSFGDVVSAQEYLGEYINESKKIPDIYTPHADYKITQRTVTTTFTEWEDV